MNLSPDMDDFNRCCRTLQVSPRASLEEIKAAYRQLARLYHPDLNPHNHNAEEFLKEINIAYETLCCYLATSSAQRRGVVSAKSSTGKQMADDRGDRAAQNTVYSVFVDALLGNSGQRLDWGQ
ncbi:J domain-containing protein [Pantanalinema rosaneae CENA516]|uniref:J domain-containing protein n=1 Tax=Pantanalinema rosaneae TaxID=1620701 RepID=UPI003D6E923C